MARAAKILGRFPAHFEADKPGKLLGDVVASLSRDLDVQSDQIGAVRRAHRLREAETLGDLYRIAALHDIRPREAEILTLRLDRIEALAEALAGADPADRADAAEALMALWDLPLEAPVLEAFTPEGGDEEQALAELLTAASGVTRYGARRQAVAARVADICRNHSLGNGTVRALLQGAANALDLDILAVHHSEDRFYHAAETHDRIRLEPPSVSLPDPAIEIFGIEENPHRTAEKPPVKRRHAECFPIIRKGFEAAGLEIRITAELDRTVGPMVVNRDQGRGVGYAGTVPAGETLRMTDTGRTMLGETDVTAFAFGFDGAVFADETAVADTDATFDKAPFVITTPPGALDREFRFPHSGGSLPVPEVAVGKTRMAFFAQEAHFGRAASPPEIPEDIIVTPRTCAGFFAGDDVPLGSVFAPGEGEIRLSAALVGFRWSEREAYKVRVLIPPRFRALTEDPEGVAVTHAVNKALERFRPAGISIETVFIDNRWVLGDGVIEEGAGQADALAVLTGGMELWPVPETPVEPET